MLGDPQVTAPPMVKGNEFVEKEFSCSSKCTSLWNHEIYSIFSMQHMHRRGLMVLIILLYYFLDFNDFYQVLVYSLEKQ